MAPNATKDRIEKLEKRVEILEELAKVNSELETLLKRALKDLGYPD